MAEAQREGDQVHVGERARKLELSVAQARGYLLQTIRLLARQEGRPARWLRASVRLSAHKKRSGRGNKVRLQIFVEDVSDESLATLLETMSDKFTKAGRDSRLDVL